MFYFADSKVGVSLLYLGGMNGECVSFTVSFFPLPGLGRYLRLPDWIKIRTGSKIKTKQTQTVQHTDS